MVGRKSKFCLNRFRKNPVVIYYFFNFKQNFKVLPEQPVRFSQLKNYTSSSKLYVTILHTCSEKVITIY